MTPPTGPVVAGLAAAMLTVVLVGATAPAVLAADPAGPTSPATPANANQADQDLTWFQLRALETNETLPSYALEGPDRAPSGPSAAGGRWGLGNYTVGTPGTYNMVVKHGYPAENHTVRTADGYLLNMVRVPRAGKPVVLLQHGMLTSSADFVVLGKGRALAYVLSEAGFDVWMCNHRGTTPSKRHERLRPTQAKFWDFSWHELGTLDLPACIDHALNTTNQTQLHYVGYSQGATTFLVLGSERPAYMEKIKTFVALSPLAFMRDIRSLPLRMLSLLPHKLMYLLRLVGVNEFMPSSKLLVLIGDVLCADTETMWQDACNSIIFAIYGSDSHQMNVTLLPEILANSPAGASVKQVVHYLQLTGLRHLLFRQFDYGWLGNIRKYRKTRPPEYDLSKVTPPTYIFHADNDLLCPPTNVDELVRRLPNMGKDGVRRVQYDKFNHLDYLYAKDARELVYNEVVDILGKHENATFTA